MGLKAKVEAIIYAAEEPITLEQIAALVGDAILAEEINASGASSEPASLPLAEAIAATEGEPPAPVVEPATKAVPSANSDSEVAGAEGGATASAEPAFSEPEAAPQASTDAPVQAARRGKYVAPKRDAAEEARVRLRVRSLVEELIADYAHDDRGIEIRQVAGGFRMATKPEHHDVVRAFARSLKPPLRLSIPALETLAVIAYKQPVTIPEISEIRGVEAAGVIGTLLDRKLITTAGRKQVIGRPILYKTSKEFLLRFGLNDLGELPSMEEFEKLALDGEVEVFTPPSDATMASAGDPGAAEASAPSPAAQSPAAEAEQAPESASSNAPEEEPQAEKSAAEDTPGGSYKPSN
jgi:segregation and condensation protein B